MNTCRRSAGRAERGASLMEANAAIALIGMATLVGGSLLSAHPRAAARLDAQRELLRAAEATVETLRSGSLPLESTKLEAVTATALPVRVTLEVRPRELPGLYEVAVTARGEVRGQPISRTVRTLVWRGQ